uniref:Uncharacterized protein n=1 Tax=Meloidogyne hapla TaxID=6305 RepID=A0A1I8BHA7_MELHA
MCCSSTVGGLFCALAGEWKSKFNNLISSLKWANLINLIPSLSSNDLNKQCEELFDKDEELDENGDEITCFIPSGSKNIDCSSLIGIRSTTNQKQITRSLIKSILFGIYQIILDVLLSQRAF